MAKRVSRVLRNTENQPRNEPSATAPPATVSGGVWFRKSGWCIVLSALTASLISLVVVYGEGWLRGPALASTTRVVTPGPVAHHVPPPAPAAADAQPRIPGEFEHQEALLLGCNELVQFHPVTLCQIVGEIYDCIRVIGLVSSDDQRQQAIAELEARGLPKDAMHFVVLPMEGMWVQDYGPIFLKTPDHRAHIVNFDYLPREIDNRVNLVLGNRFHIPVDSVPLALEGGNLLTNGRGLCLTTTGMIQVNLARGLSMEKIKELLREHFAFTTVSVMHMLNGEPTGHADLFSVFVAPDVVVVGDYSTEVDAENAKILDENAAQLSKLNTPLGPMKVVRIPMPTHEGNLWRSYTNVIFANGKLLVPQYPRIDAAGDARALAVYRSLLPDWEVVGIDCTSLIVKQGALHCISLHVPWLPEDADDVL
ncbi:MAG TPA: agmatine deiminase family protein [Pirellulales bacterium]|jgi:agmatine/peptidylarginine deiminase|nr:agmatine deiminase family protein [Pirellulales bacterium]